MNDCIRRSGYALDARHAQRAPCESDRTGGKGVYQVRLELEMHGDWAVQIDLSGAVRDRVIAMLRFEEKEVTDVKPSSSRRGH